MIDFIPTIKSLEERGLGFIELTPLLQQAISHILAEANNFFHLPDEVKQLSYCHGMHKGYRGMGIEYSQSPDRPDLNESFSFRLADNHKKEGSIDASGLPLYNNLKHLTSDYDVLISDLFKAIASYFKIDSSELFKTDLDSWLQTNYYKPRNSQREYMQDRHEDGHLVTLWLANTPGLEVFYGDSLEPETINPLPNQLVVMSGQLITLLTGGKIPPLFHQVRRHSTVQERLSLMYFVNPNSNQHIKPWIINDSNKGIDIAAQGAINPHQHGLPQL